MQLDRYFYISTLPALGQLGSDVPMGPADLMEHVEEKPRWQKLVGAVLLSDDLLQREAFLAGEIEEVEPAVLTVQQTRSETALPECLSPSPEREQDRIIEADALWEAYFRHAAEVGRAAGSRFLVRWIGFEVALRNALAATRAKRLGLEERGYLVAADLAEESEDLSPVLTEWEAAPTPLAGLLVVIRARWSWIDRHEAWFSFSEDELLVYAARLMLMEQWNRTADQDESATNQVARP